MDMLMRDQPRREIVRYLLDLPVIFWKKIGTGEMYDLLRCIEWMQVDSKSTSPIAPYYDYRPRRGADVRLYLPAAQFKTVTGREYAMLDDMYRAFIQDVHDADVEAQMIALILRPAGASADPASDPRVPLLSKDQTAAWLPAVKALPESVRAYMSMYISAHRQMIHTTYRHWLFPEKAAVEEGQEPEDEGLNFGWWGAFMDVARDGVFGTYDQVLDTTFHSICQHLIMNVEEYRRRRQEADHAQAMSNARTR